MLPIKILTQKQKHSNMRKNIKIKAQKNTTKKNHKNLNNDEELTHKHSEKVNKQRAIHRTKLPLNINWRKNNNQNSKEFMIWICENSMKTYTLIKNH